MSSNTKNGKDSGHTGRCVPLADDPDMIRLKHLFRQLDPDRQAQLLNDLEKETQEEGKEDVNSD